MTWSVAQVAAGRTSQACLRHTCAMSVALVSMIGFSKAINVHAKSSAASGPPR